MFADPLLDSDEGRPLKLLDYYPAERGEGEEMRVTYVRTDLLTPFDIERMSAAAKALGRHATELREEMSNGFN